MSDKINREIAYEVLHKYLEINKEQISQLSDDKLKILLNFVSNELINKINKSGRKG